MREFLKTFVFIVPCSILLLIAAFWNGYPLLYSDTAAYVFSGFNLMPPNDRPIMYGLFLRVFSINGRFIWLALFSQSAMLSFSIYQLFITLVPKQKNIGVWVLMIFILTLTTGVSWTSSLMIADIFTSIALLSAISFLLKSEVDTASIFLLVIFILSCSTHASHILLFNVVLFCALIVYFFSKGISDRRNSYIKLMILLFSCNLTYLTARQAMNKSGYIFFAGAMVENGIMKKVLDDECYYLKFKLCQYKDSLPEHGYLFLWDGNSPLYKIDGWGKGKNELCQIRDISFSEPKYLYLHVKASAQATLRQLSLFKIADGTGDFKEESNVFKEVTCWFKSSKESYFQSKQYKGEINGLLSTNEFLSGCMAIYVILYLVSLFAFWKKLTANHLIIQLIIVIAVILNAFVSGTFANAIDRLGCKMMWLIPLGLFLIWTEIYQQKKLAKVN